MNSQTPLNEYVPDVSVIVVTYNAAVFIEDCLDSLNQQTISNVEVIVVDNHSTDGTVEILRRRSDIQRIERDFNSGFTGGVNCGYRYASGRYIALLNPDACPDPQWLEALLKMANVSEYECVGIFASKMINDSGDRLCIDSAGDGCTTFGKGFKRGEGEGVQKYSRTEYVFGACGGAMFVRRELIQDIGFLDDYMFLILDDTEFCLRAQSRGWRVLYVPDAMVYHRVRSSIGSLSTTAVFYSLRNADYVWLKLFPASMMIGSLPAKVLAGLMNAVYFALLHRKPVVWFRSRMSIVKDLPKILEARRSFFQSSIVVDTRHLRSLMTSILNPQLICMKLMNILGIRCRQKPENTQKSQGDA